MSSRLALHSGSLKITIWHISDKKHFLSTQVFKNLFEGSLLEDSPFVACISQSEHPVI